MDAADCAMTEQPAMLGPAGAVHASPRRPRRLTAAAALRSVPDGVIVFGARLRVRVCNHLAASILRLDGVVHSVGASLPQLLDASGRLDNAGRAALLDAAAVGQRDGASSITLVLRDGATVFADIRQIDDGAWCLILPAPRPALIETAGAHAMSAHDPLTGLADRAMFRDRVAEALDRGGECAVLIIDLDRFQAINDTHGHATGDVLLQAVADRLRSALRSDDLTARLSADEFAMLLPREAISETALLVARRVVDMIGRPYVVRGLLINIAASIGVAISPNDGDEADELMRNAGFALRQAKAGGRNTWRAFDPEIGARARDRHALASDLRRALEGDQFVLNYQPQITLLDRRLVGFEALLRWQHPQRGLIPPDHFIPLAEETGLIEPIGEWVLKTACVEAMRWPEPLTVAVNVSAVQFTQAHNLVRAVREALADSGLPGPRLDIEITESVLLSAASTHDTLAALRALGVRISMDDFGTGYSSLGQLRSFPFDKIKIDRCFVRDIETSAESAAVIRAISVLGPSLGMSTTVEGVETEAQAVLVAELGCTDMQGFLISRPVPAAAVPALIGRWGGGVT